MDYKVIPFQTWHVDVLYRVGGFAEMGLPEFDPTLSKYLETENSWTLVGGDVPLLCGGTMKQWPGRHTAWAYLNRHTGPQMIRTTRAAKWIIAQANGRIESTVRADFPEGHRWVKLLGFEVETPILKRYGPMGEDHVAYVRFN